MKERKQFEIFIRDDLSKINKFTYFIRASFLITIRTIIIGFLFVSGYLLLKFVTLIFNVKDFEKEQNHLYYIITRFICRVIFKLNVFALGFDIKKKILKSGNPTPQHRQDDYKIIIANHVSWFDIIYFGTLDKMPSYLFYHKVREAPLIGFYAKVLQSIFFNKEVKSEKIDALKKLNQRATDLRNNKRFGPFIIFPEGSTKRRELLLPFKKGAFIYDLPIKIYVFDYKNNINTPEFMFLSGVGSFFHTMNNFKNNLTVYEYDRILYPNDYIINKNEIDWVKFSNDSSKIIRDCINLKNYEGEDVYKIIVELKKLKELKFK